jgi:HEAT repeat protein
MAKIKKTQAPFKIVINELLDASKPFSPTNLHRFSDINPADLAALRIAWPKIDLERRVHLLEDLEDLVDTDTLVSFDDLARFAMEDPDSRIRAVAIRLLWETNDETLIPIFIRMMKNDSDEMVRAGAAGALGLFVFLGELEEVDKANYQKVYDALLAVYHGPDKPVVRRRAVEALGYSGNDEVPAIIEESYASPDRDWQASALFAMGRSADERWESYILAKLDSSEDDVQLEAVRAAGELEIDKARKPILNLLKEPSEVDFDLKSAAVWSLSQIGGQGVREKLERMSEAAEDDDESFFIDEALDNLDFKEGTGAFGIMDMTPVIDEEHTHIVDLASEDEDDDDKDIEFGIIEDNEDEEEDDNPLYGTKN